MESKKRNKSIAEWIGRPFKSPSRNKDEEDKDGGEDVGAPLASTEDGYPSYKDVEGPEDDWEDDGIYNQKDTVIYNAEDNEEETSVGQEGGSLSSKSSESSDNED